MSGLSFSGSIGSFAGCDGDGCDDCDCGDCDCDCSCPDCDCDCSCPDCDCDCDCCARCWDEVCYRCLGGVYHCILEGCESTLCCVCCDSTSTTNEISGHGGGSRHSSISLHEDELLAMGMLHGYNNESRSATATGVVHTKQPGKDKASEKAPKKKKERKEGDNLDDHDIATYEDDMREEVTDGEAYERRVMAGQEVIEPTNGAVPEEVKVALSSPEAEGYIGTGGYGVDPKAGQSQKDGGSSSVDYPTHAVTPSAPPPPSETRSSDDTTIPTVAPPSYDDVVTSQPGGSGGGSGSTDDVV